jgi:Flp pilus assembly protein TadG
MSTPAFLSALARSTASLGRDRRGVSAVEFALVLPVMITLYIGTVEVAKGVAIQRKVTQAARTVADLATQFRTIKNADKDNVLSAGSAILFPTSATPLKITLSAVYIDKNSVAKIEWTDGYHGGTLPKRSIGDVVNLPADVLKVPDSQLIWAEVSYSYDPQISDWIIKGTIDLKDSFFMRPRLAEKVVRDPS